MSSACKLAPDQITVAVTNFRADVLHTLVAADPHRPADGGRHRRPRRGRRAALRRGRRPRNVATSAASASACPASSSGRRALPAKPDLRRARRALRRGADAAARRPGVDRQRRQSRDARRALVRSGARPQRFPGRQRRAQPRPRHPAQWRTLPRRERPHARSRRPAWSARPATAAAGSATWRPKSRCSARATPRFPPGAAWRFCCGERTMATRRASLRLRPQARRLAAPSPISSPCSRRRRSSLPGRAMASSEHFIRPFARDGRGPPAAEPRRRLGPRRARMGRQHLGARRGGDDVARTLWRAVGHDRPGAASRVD